MKPSLLAIAFLGATFSFAPIAIATTPPSVVVLTYSGPINPASAEYIARGIADAEARNAAASTKFIFPMEFASFLKPFTNFGGQQPPAAK
jgi:hypothetical protein